MKIITLDRFASSLQYGTFGAYKDENGSPICLALERPWLNNQAMISCVCKGEFLFKRENHPKFGDTFLGMNIPNRDGIYLHKGNVFMESKGCPMYGSSIADIGGLIGVSGSGEARSRFLRFIGQDQEFKLIIEGCVG